MPISPIVRLVAAFGALVSLLAAGAPSARAEIGSYLLVDAASGAVLAADEPTQPWYPASITKLMTAYVTFRAVREGRITLKSPVVMTKNAAAEPPSKMGFKVGTVLTVETAVKIIIVKSANDVTVALAEAVGGGSEAAFIAEMNATARALGMNRTHFNNPHGLPDDGQVTTARDMAILTRALLTEFPEYRPWFRIYTLQLGKKTIRNHNRLLERFRGADGMKTGFICNSGFNMVATATRNGRTLIAVVLGAYTAAERNEFAARLLTEGFAASGRGGRNVSSIPEPATRATPPSRRDYVCGPKRQKGAPVGEEEDEPLVAGARDRAVVGTAGSRLVVASAEAAPAKPGKPGKRRSYLEDRVETMPPVPISLGGAVGAPGGSPYADVAAAAAPGGSGAPIPRPRPGTSLAAAPAVAPIALAPADEMVGSEAMGVGFDVATPAAAAASPGKPPKAPATVASAAQPGLSVPVTALPRATQPPMELSPTEWLSDPGAP